jgi:predicted acyl esterase
VTVTTELLFQPGVSPLEGGAPEPTYSSSIADGMRIERNVLVPLADDTRIYVDLFIPVGVDEAPALIAWGPYGKINDASMYQQFHDDVGGTGGGVRPEWVTKYTPFEGPDPVAWCGAGYSVIVADPRGTWWSGGDYASVWDEREARDCADLISWAAGQEWCSGKVGMSGVSYLAVAQWWAAAVRPEALAAINPCEGLSDVYREFAFHGGIPCAFPAFWQKNRFKFSKTKLEALADMIPGHPLDDAYWESKRPDLAAIDVPAYVIAGWGDQGLHTRGTIAAFEALGSEHKYLEVHGRKKWEYYHSPESRERQILFFDRFLKGEDNEVGEWPTVRFESRVGFYEGTERTAAAWPPPEVRERTLYVDLGRGELVDAAPDAEATSSYEASSSGAGVVLRHVFDRPTDVVGGMRLRLWLELQGAEDVDLFVAVKKLDAAGEQVDFAYANVLEHGPTALGWLRASHRELDEERSTAVRPWHGHRREDPIAAGEVVPVDVEIWPSATRFEPGESLQVEIGGADPYPNAKLWLHVDTRDSATVVLHAGGERDSHLVIPTLEPGDAEPDWTTRGA